VTTVAECAGAPSAAELAAWLAEQTLDGSRARSIPDEIRESERIRAAGIASVHHCNGETHGVLVVTNERIICQGHDGWERWECESAAAVSFLPIEDQVTSYLVEAGDGTIRVLRYFGEQSELDAPMARALQDLVTENGARSAEASDRPDGRFARECSKHSML
jgi:hypothetical protein